MTRSTSLAVPPPPGGTVRVAGSAGEVAQEKRQVETPFASTRRDSLTVLEEGPWEGAGPVQVGPARSSLRLRDPANAESGSLGTRGQARNRVTQRATGGRPARPRTAWAPRARRGRPAGADAPTRGEVRGLPCPACRRSCRCPTRGAPGLHDWGADARHHHWPPPRPAREARAPRSGREPSATRGPSGASQEPRGAGGRGRGAGRTQGRGSGKPGCGLTWRRRGPARSTFSGPRPAAAGMTSRAEPAPPARASTSTAPRSPTRSAARTRIIS